MPKSWAWENLAPQDSILVRNVRLEQHSKSHFFGTPVFETAMLSFEDVADNEQNASGKLDS